MKSLPCSPGLTPCKQMTGSTDEPGAGSECGEDETRDRLGSERTTCSGGSRGSSTGTAGWCPVQMGGLLPTSHQVTPGRPLGPCDPIWTSFSVCSWGGEQDLSPTRGWELLLWSMVLKEKQMWDGEGGAGSGLESLGWPHTRPSREPFGQGNAGGSLWAAKDCHRGISPQGGGLGPPLQSLYSLRQVCLWGWGVPPDPPQRSCAPGL